MARLVVDDFRGGFEKGPWWQRLFNGYSITTWMVVINLGSTGLLVSWLMKYADNIVKVPYLSLVKAFCVLLLQSLRDSYPAILLIRYDYLMVILQILMVLPVQ